MSGHCRKLMQVKDAAACSDADYPYRPVISPKQE